MDDIDRSHRIGKRDLSRNLRGRKAKIRPIVVKFISYQDRYDVFSNKKKLKDSKISIAENLSKERYVLFKKCVDFYGKHNCWSYRGSYDQRVYCINNRGEKVNITNDEDLTDDARAYNPIKPFIMNNISKHFIENILTTPLIKWE